MMHDAEDCKSQNIVFCYFRGYLNIKCYYNKNYKCNTQKSPLKTSGCMLCVMRWTLKATFLKEQNCFNGTNLQN